MFSNYAVGYNNVDVKAATKHGIAVGNTPGQGPLLISLPPVDIAKRVWCGICGVVPNLPEQCGVSIGLAQGMHRMDVYAV